VFLAFNSKDFANKWFRPADAPSEVGLLTLDGYLKFWGWAYLVVTLGLAILKREERTKNTDGITDVYQTMWGILKLKNIQTFIVIHLIAKIGFQANDAVTSLKLLDKGFSQEDLALTILIDFPIEIFLGYYIGKWCQTYPPMHIWCWAFVGRLAAAGFAQFVVSIFPAGGTTTWYLLMVICEHVLSTFMNTVMFVAVSAFHAKISDPVIGGTYMTLLATYVFPSPLFTFGAGRLTISKRVESRRDVPSLLCAQAGGHVHGGDVRASGELSEGRAAQGQACDAALLLCARSGQAPMQGRRGLLQRDDGRVLCDERDLYHHRGGDVLGVHQAGGAADPGTAAAGVEACSIGGWAQARARTLAGRRLVTGVVAVAVAVAVVERTRRGCILLLFGERCAGRLRATCRGRCRRCRGGGRHGFSRWRAGQWRGADYVNSCSSSI
jgi:hypothetical protein